MGFLDDAKQTVEAGVEKAKRAAHDVADKVSDRVDEVKAEADVKKAEAERDSVKARNDAKDDLRG